MKKLFYIFSLFLIIACKNENNTSTEEAKTLDSSKQVTTEEPSNEKKSESNELYAPQSSNDETAAKIINFLKNDYLKNDLKLLSDEDRKFQYFSVDLNEDGKDEYFVNFISSYFCGTGGCSMVLLDNESNIITNFSVMSNPVYIEKSKKNGWRDILVRNVGELKLLQYNNGKYPSNPSIVAKAPYDAPSGSAIVMFDDNFSKAKTYTF